MAFLAAASQKSILGLQKNFLTLQMIHVQNEQQYYKDEMSQIQAAYQQKTSSSGTNTYEYDPAYILAKSWDEKLDTEKESIENEIQLLDAQINSMKTLVQNSIKNSCTLNISGGS